MIIKATSSNGSLLKKVQPSLCIDGKPFLPDQEYLIPKDASDTMDMKQAALYLKVAVRTLRHYIAIGKVYCVRYSRKKRILLKKDLDTFILSNRTIKTFDE